MNRKSALAALLAATLLTAGCTTTGSTNMSTGQLIGTGGGALAGAFVGNRIGGGSLAGTLLGAAAGAILGNSLASMLDDQEKAELDGRTKLALAAQEPGQTVAWTDPRTNNNFQVAVVSEKVDSGRRCREFRQSVTTAAGKTGEGGGTACTTDGITWS